ncbi:MAG: hypothetical protein HRT42_13205 [Campylobacteraceae bacterium]|nr:hypothetical protein [Campylobacteraceae bacterium]
MITIFLLLILFYILFSLYAFYKAKKYSRLFYIDIFSPFILVLFWVIIVSFGIGHQSLSHIIELPIVLVFSLILLYTRVFIINKVNINYKKNAYLSIAFSLFFLVLLRLFMPFLAE